MASHARPVTNQRGAVVDLSNLESSSDEDQSMSRGGAAMFHRDIANSDTIDLTHDTSSDHFSTAGIRHGVATASSASAFASLDSNSYDDILGASQRKAAPSATKSAGLYGIHDVVEATPPSPPSSLDEPISLKRGEDDLFSSDSNSYDDILGASQRKPAPSATKSTGLYEIHDAVEATPPSPPATLDEPISLKRGFDDWFPSEECSTGRGANPLHKKSRMRENTRGGARENNWNENYSEAKDACDNNGFSAMISGDSLYGWMNRAKEWVKRLDSHTENGGSPAAFDTKQTKKGGAWTTERINLVRPLVESFVKRRGARGKPKIVKSSSRSRPGRSNSLDKIASVDDVDNMAVEQCKNPHNQDLFVKLLQYARVRIEHGTNQNNQGHVYEGKRRLDIARRIRATKLHIDSTAKVQQLCEFVGNRNLATAFTTYFEHRAFPDE